MNEIIVTTPERLKAAIRETIQQVIKEEKGSILPEREEKVYLTRHEVAERLHISLVTLNKLTQNGRIKAFRIGGRVLYKPEDITLAVMEMRTSKFGR